MILVIFIIYYNSTELYFDVVFFKHKYHDDSLVPPYFVGFLLYLAFAWSMNRS